MNLPPRPLSSNLTTPSIKANSVSSLPRPTLLPGFHFVPRCRARMLPPSTCSPPNFFKPSRCAFESRPLREEPTPFLCAMMKPLFLPDGIDLHRREVLAVAARALVLLAALLLEDDDLLAAAVLDDRAGDARAVNRGRADSHLT